MPEGNWVGYALIQSERSYFIVLRLSSYAIGVLTNTLLSHEVAHQRFKMYHNIQQGGQVAKSQNR